MFPQYRFKFAQLLGVIALALPLTAFGMIAGRADFVVGKVEATTADGARRALIKGSEINAGETINTDVNARAQIRFIDGGFISLQPNTVFRVDEFNYQNKTGGGERSFFSLLKGGLRAITGAIGHTNRDTYRVTTPVATIGIRGTGYNAMLSDGLLVNVGEGAISLTNNAGLLLVSAGGAAFVANINTPPAPTTEHPNMPPASFHPVEEHIYIVGDDRNPQGIPEILPHLVSGDGYALAYSAKQCGGGCYSAGLAVLTGVTTHFNNLGQLQQYETTSQGGAVGTASQSFFATDGIIGWGRWDGSTAIFPVNGGASPHPLTNGTFHYVVGIPTAIMPTFGTATYALIGYTIPTSTDVSSGWSQNGTLTANFFSGASVVGVNLLVTNLIDTYTINDTVTSIGSTFSGATLNNTTGTSTLNTLCANGCTTSINGFFAGDNASHAGLAYSINDSFSRNIQGVAAFTSGGITTQPLVAGQ